MIDHKDFKYDVAFSFLKEDEIIAYDVNDLIQDRVKTFIYSKDQEGLVGFDGEEKFHEVFGQTSRFVVIFYRKNWGQTPWTRIEETAIKNRSLDQGYGFSIFVPLEKSPMPIWLPRTIIWFDYVRWGSTGLASVIESKLSESGVEIKKPETALEFAKRKKRSLELKKEIDTYLQSHEAFIEANQEFAIIIAEAKKLAEALSDLGLSSGLAGQRGHELTIKSGWFSLTFCWSVSYSNSLKDSSLVVTIVKRVNDLVEKSFTIKREKYIYDMNEIKRKGWVTTNKIHKKFYQSNELVDNWVKALISLIEQ